MCIALFCFYLTLNNKGVAYLMEWKFIIIISSNAIILSKSNLLLKQIISDQTNKIYEENLDETVLFQIIIVSYT